MKIRNKEIDWKYTGKSIFCIGLGTGIGLIVYGIFLYFHIAIFGWNLGLIFAPLTAGYVETIATNKILGNDLGAISAFFLFIYTTTYSFILNNPTLGVNIITAGSILVILQSAFPTLINYILLLVIGAVTSNLKWDLRKLKKGVKKIAYHIRWTTEYVETPNEEILHFDENKSNQMLNSLDFFFITSTDITGMNHELLGIYQGEIIMNNEDSISVKCEEIEARQLANIKEGKDKCLINLVNKIKADGGNGILDLNMQYGLIGLGKNNIHITATGIGISIKR